MITKQLRSYITIGLVSCAGVMLTSCEDQIMEWKTPDGHGAVTKTEIPLEVKEVLANYESLKTYSSQYMPKSTLGLGIGAAIYTDDNDPRSSLANSNFQMITLGNAMKHDAIVGNSGSLTFTTVDNVIESMPDGMALYGHNFFWHTQQNQTYLKSLIKPTLVIETDSDIKNVLAGDDSDFEGGTTGKWGSWGNSSTKDVGPGFQSNYSMHLTNPSDANFWNAQCAYTFDSPLAKDVEFTIRFKAKSTSPSGQLQFQYQNGSTYGSQGGYNTFDVGTSWATYEFSFTITDYDDVNRIILNFGKVGAEYWIDNVEFGEKQDNPINYLVSVDFEDGTTGKFGSWGNGSSKDVANEGYNSSKSMHLTNPSDANCWSAQCAYDLEEPLKNGTEYIVRFKAKSSSASGQLQFQYQNGQTYGSQGAYNTFDVGTSWVTCEHTFTCSHDDANRIIINFGQVGAEYWIDDFEFGTPVPTDPMDNILAGDDSDFEGGSTGKWGSWGNSSSKDVADQGHNSSKSMHLNNPSDANFWSAQCAYDLADPLQQNKKYIIQFYAKSSSAAGQLQFQYQNGQTYGSQGGYNTFEVGTDWVLCEHEFTVSPEDANRIIINFGQVGAEYYIDDIKFGLAKDQSAAAARVRAVKRAAKSYYVIKSAEEKSEALTGAMESWVKGMAEHLAEKGVTPYGYDVINEAITDGNGNKVRGIDNVFGMSGDTEPTENEADGLELNWESGHFYWGYYVKDYGVKAFQLARKYLPEETKLFINDYNLETSPSKLAALIEWVKSIDAANGSAIVDGIGTQMHIAINPTDDATSNTSIVSNLKEKVDAQFKTLAATGKLVRVTELDVDMCKYNANGEREAISSPSAAQYKCQADVYKMVFESYKTNVPEAQQSGITIWSLTDNPDEHEYWLKDGKPNLFDADNLRKWAYKGACDGIAGEDLGLKFGGEDYKAYYERSNVSETVK